MDRQIRSFFAVVALVGAIILAIYHFVSGSPLGDYWLAAALLILAVVIWVWPTNDRTALFDLDPALRGGNNATDAPDHAKEAYPLHLLEDAPQALGDVPEVAPSELEGRAVKIIQDSQVEERLTEIVAEVEATEVVPIDPTDHDISGDQPSAAVEAPLPETPIEPTTAEPSPVEAIDVVETDAITTDAITTDATITEDGVQVDAVVPDSTTPAGKPDLPEISKIGDPLDVPVVDTTPLPDYAEITADDEGDAKDNHEAYHEDQTTDAPEPYSVPSTIGDDTARADIPTDSAPAEPAPAEPVPVEPPLVEPTLVEPAPLQPPPVDPTTAPDADQFDLTKIEGIGAKYQEALHNAGITTFEQLAVLSVDQLVEIAQAAGMRRSGSMNTWAEQAALAAKGDWDALQKLQDELVGGRRES